MHAELKVSQMVKSMESPQARPVRTIDREKDTSGDQERRREEEEKVSDLSNGELGLLESHEPLTKRDRESLNLPANVKNNNRTRKTSHLDYPLRKL